MEDACRTVFYVDWWLPLIRSSQGESFFPDDYACFIVCLEKNIYHNFAGLNWLLGVFVCICVRALDEGRAWEWCRVIFGGLGFGLEDLDLCFVKLMIVNLIFGMFYFLRWNCVVDGALWLIGPIICFSRNY